MFFFSLLGISWQMNYFDWLGLVIPRVAWKGFDRLIVFSSVYWTV